MTKIIRPLLFVLLLCVANISLKAQVGDKPLDVNYQKIEKFVQSHNPTSSGL